MSQDLDARKPSFIETKFHFWKAPSEWRFPKCVRTVLSTVHYSGLAKKPSVLVL